MNLQEIKYNVAKGIPVSESEYAYLIHNDRASFFGFMVNNNPASLNNILRHKLGYTELGFAPDKKAIARVLDIIIEKNNQDELKSVLEGFQVDTSKISKTLLEEIKSGGLTFDFYPAGFSSAKTASEIAGNVGNSIGNFLNPLFGSSTVTTTTAPAPTPSSAGSKTGIIVFVFAVLVIGAFVLLKKKTTV